MRRTHACLAATLALACGTLGGCYQKVVGVKGPASQKYNIEEPSIGRDESVWSNNGTIVPRPTEPDRYTGTSLDQTKPVPNKKQVPGSEP